MIVNADPRKLVFWRTLSLFVALPVVVIMSMITYRRVQEESKKSREPYLDLPYMRRRTKVQLNCIYQEKEMRLDQSFGSRAKVQSCKYRIDILMTNESDKQVNYKEVCNRQFSGDYLINKFINKLIKQRRRSYGLLALTDR